MCLGEFDLRTTGPSDLQIHIQKKFLQIQVVKHSQAFSLFVPGAGVIGDQLRSSKQP